MDASSSYMHIKNGQKYFDQRLLQNMKTEPLEYFQYIFNFRNPSNLVDLTGATLLHHAADFGNTGLIQLLIDLGSNVNAQDILGRTPLLLAVEKQDIQNKFAIIKCLLDANASIYATDMNGETVISKIFTQLPDMTLYMTKMYFAKIECETPEEISEMVETLLKANVPGYAVLLRNPAVLKIFLEMGIEINDCNSALGDTALHLAAELAYVDHLKLLIEHGANVNITNHIGDTPLMEIRHQNVEVLKILLDKGIDITVYNSKGNMQTYYALTFGSKEVVRLILQYIDVDTEDMNGQTALHYIAINDNPEVYKELIGKTFNANARDERGITALHLAVERNNVEFVKFLIDQGADVNVANNFTEYTPLFIPFEMYKSWKRARKCIEILLDYGADTQHLTSYGMSIFRYVTDTIEKCDDDEELLFRKRTSLPMVSQILARLAALEMIGGPIKQQIYDDINGDHELRNIFDVCKRELNEVKKEVNKRLLGSTFITIFLRCLTEHHDVVIRLTADEKIVEKLLHLIRRNGPKSYCLKTLRRRIIQGSRLAIVRENAILTIADLMGLTCNYYDISEKVLSYLSTPDWRNLNRISLNIH